MIHVCEGKFSDRRVFFGVLTPGSADGPAADGWMAQGMNAAGRWTPGKRIGKGIVKMGEKVINGGNVKGLVKGHGNDRGSSRAKGGGQACAKHQDDRRLKLLEIAKTTALIILGNAIYATGIVLFILPTGLITGGTTGIALIVRHFTGLPISTFVGAFNVVMFAVGYLVLGRKFAMTTLVSTLSFPVLLGTIERVVGDLVLTEDLMLAALFSGLLIGLGLAVVIRLGASTGGMDIPPLILQKKLRIPVSVGLYGFDFVILAGQMLFTPKETCLYGIVLIIVYTLTLDKILSIGEAKTRFEIVTKHTEEMRRAILEDLDRGVTMIHGQTGFEGNETEVLLCVIAPRELYQLEKIVYSIDPEAFVIKTRATSVHGRGFSMAKDYAA